MTKPAPPRHTSARKALGNTGEDLAARTLEQAGFAILERNWRSNLPDLRGEIDLVVEERAPDLVGGKADEPWRVFVEVRTRRGDAFGTALQSVDGRKQRQLRALASAWVQERHWNGPWRIDVVAIQMDSGGHLLSLEHLRHAITGE